MHSLIKSIEAQFDESNDSISITIIDAEDNETDITAKVTSIGIFRFSYVHPEDNEKYSYEGVFNTESSRHKFTIFPIYGPGVISTQPIICDG